MVFDPYASCPCGSGKKFKWCCQPIHQEIARAYELDEEGQHEAALRLMDDVAARHADNPEVWGRQALLLFQNEKAEEAEQALEKAFALNRDYAFGYFLKARFRLAEGEIAGALLLLRRAAELYSPEATEILGQVQLEIFDCEMRLNHPIAAHAAAELALRLNPASDNLRQGVERVFGAENPNLPPTAKQPYRFQPLPANVPAERRQAWETAINTAATGKLQHAVQAFQQLTEQDANDAPALYNLALSHAWLGSNADAVDALDRYVALEADENRAAEAWALGEVLRVGQGMEDRADVVEHSVTVPLRDPQAFVGTLGELERERLLTGAQVSQEEGILTAVVLEPPPPALTPEQEARQLSPLGAYLVLLGNLLRLWNTNKERVDRVHDTLRQRAAGALADAIPTRGPVKFHDILSDALAFPQKAGSAEEAQQRLAEHLERYFEESWLQRPLKSLGGVSPLDAAGHGVLRKKLRGVVQFVQECAAIAHLPYDFDRLRRKLGLLEGAPAAAREGQAADIGAMSAAELAGLSLDQLDYGQLEQAYQTAQRLDARELAGKFAMGLVAQPPRPDRPDRYPLFNHLIHQALAQGDKDAALDFVNAGEKDDCEHNEGRRRNDYELRRAQVHAKRGEFDQARDVFDRLIERVPSELKVRTAAAETMLSARQGSQALRYAEAGLAEARKQQNRDSEGHFQELSEAAKRQGG